MVRFRYFPVVFVAYLPDGAVLPQRETLSAPFALHPRGCSTVCGRHVLATTPSARASRADGANSAGRATWLHLRHLRGQIAQMEPIWRHLRHPLSSFYQSAFSFFLLFTSTLFLFFRATPLFLFFQG